MTDPSKLSKQATLLAISSVISSRASVDGRAPSCSPGGPTSVPCGPAPAPAPLSRRQVRGSDAHSAAARVISAILARPDISSASIADVIAMRTVVTYGRSSVVSSASAARQRSLENRLRVLTEGCGSPLYSLTWKQWDMPLVAPICALRASVPHKSVNASGGALTGWPTVRAADGTKNVRTSAGADRETTRKGGPQDIVSAALMTGWPTPNCPRSHDSDNTAGKVYTSKKQRDLPEDAWLTGWFQDDTVPGCFVDKMTGWPTPMAQSSGAGNSDSSRRTAALCGAKVAGHNLSLPDHWYGPVRITSSGETLTGSMAGMDSSGPLNPAHSRWLMGFPPEWCACAPMGTRSSRKSPQRS